MEPVHGRQLQDSTRAPSAAAAAGGAAGFSSPPPPPAPPVLPHRGWGRERAGDGSRGAEGSSSSAAETDRKGKKVAFPSPLRSASSSPSTPLATDAAAAAAAAAAGAGTSCSAAEEEQVEPPHANKKLWSKVLNYSKKKILGRKGRRILNRNSTGSLSPELPKIPHVAHQTIPITRAINYYFGDLHTAMQLHGQIPTNVLDLLRPYSEFRPVNGDGECFYRSFIFSYLEQVVDRQDTQEEHRLLAAVKRVSMRHAHLGWTSEFSRSHKAFEKLIKKVMRWKRQSRWSSVVSTNSYRKQKLLKFFSTYDKTKHIFIFLRLVAAIWICSHREEYEPHIAGLREDYSLKDWCFRHVTPPHELTDHVQMRALAGALEVPLKVEQLNIGPTQDIYTGPGVPDVRVTLLFTGNHYDIIYPCPLDVSSSHQTSPGENPSDESSSQQILLG